MNYLTKKNISRLIYLYNNKTCFFHAGLALEFFFWKRKRNVLTSFTRLSEREKERKVIMLKAIGHISLVYNIKFF